MTTTATPALQPIPKLIKTPAPRQLETLGEPWVTLGEESRRLFAEAVKLRSAYDSSDKAINEARTLDQRALADAARAGKPDPGRKNEMKVLVEQETAHNKALGATIAANDAILAVRNAINGNEGNEAIEALHDRIAKNQEAITHHAHEANKAIADTSADAALIELIARTRAGKVHGAVSHMTERPPMVAAPGGQLVNAAGVLESIAEFAPQIELP